jgi:hypothetical protein
MSPTGSYECRVPAQGDGVLHTAVIQIVIGKELKCHSHIGEVKLSSIAFLSTSRILSASCNIIFDS